MALPPLPPPPPPPPAAARRFPVRPLATSPTGALSRTDACHCPAAARLAEQLESAHTTIAVLEGELKTERDTKETLLASFDTMREDIRRDMPLPAVDGLQAELNDARAALAAEKHRRDELEADSKLALERERRIREKMVQMRVQQMEESTGYEIEELRKKNESLTKALATQEEEKAALCQAVSELMGKRTA